MFASSQLSERTIILEVTARQLRGMQQEMSDVAWLHSPKLAGDELGNTVRAMLGLGTASLVWTSKVAVCATGLKVHEDDVVELHSGIVAQVLFHVSVHSECISCITEWNKLRVDPNMYSIGTRATFVDTDSISNVCTYRLEGDVAYVIPPAGFK